MEIIRRYLPIQCYASKRLDYRPKPLDSSGIVQHYFSGRYAFPESKFDLDKCWELMHDLNMEPEDRVFNIYTGPRVPASAHFFVARDGRVVQMVPLEFQAWHAGKSSFRGRSGCNAFMIGIENIAAKDIPYTEVQMKANAALCVYLMQRFNFNKDMITGHELVAPGRKKDPGELFNWKLLYDLIDEKLGG